MTDYPFDDIGGVRPDVSAKNLAEYLAATYSGDIAGWVSKATSRAAYAWQYQLVHHVWESPSPRGHGARFWTEVATELGRLADSQYVYAGVVLLDLQRHFDIKQEEPAP